MKYLLGKDSRGKFRVAIISLCKNNIGHYCIYRKTGCVGGKLTDQPIIEVTQTHQNRTWLEQATLQYDGICKKFLDKGYVEVDKHPNNYTKEELNELFGKVPTNQHGVIKPMLAKQADKVTNSKIFDKIWLASRKIDGVRCLMYFGEDGEVHTSSRGGEHFDYSTVHIRKHPIMIDIFQKYPGIILDGELYKHGKTLQQISGVARLEKNIYDCDWLEYWIYDLIDTKNMNIKASDRENLLNQICSEYNIDFNPYQEWEKGDLQIQHVFQIEVFGWNNIEKFHDQYVSEGFEGVVIRDPDKPYKPNGRTNDMIKIKQYKSEDFVVVGYELGLRGSEDMVFICELEDGRTFKAMPCGDREIKAEYVENFNEKYLGHKVECTFFNYSDDGIPTQPKARIFRFDLE